MGMSFLAISLYTIMPIPYNSILSVALLVAGRVSSSPLGGFQSRATTINPVINANFPDPSILQDSDGTWYTFGTNSGGHNVQVAKATSVAGPWTVLDLDLLPVVGSWSNGADVWAPDIRKIGDKYVLYYTAVDSQQTTHHCIGTATSDTILGAYTPDKTALACPLSAGGAIDPSGFTDADGTLYVVYKVDGNNIGHGGNCNNGVAPIVPTPIMLQELAAGGTTPIGDPIQILDRDDGDGPLVEAPNMILVNGVYFLFFSSNYFDGPLYDISYATASSVKGPFTKAAAPYGPLMVTNNPYELIAPGGATATVDGKSLVFHANCDAGRRMYESGIQISGTDVTVG